MSQAPKQAAGDGGVCQRHIAIAETFNGGHGDGGVRGLMGANQIQLERGPGATPGLNGDTCGPLLVVDAGRRVREREFAAELNQR